MFVTLVSLSPSSVIWYKCKIYLIVTLNPYHRPLQKSYKIALELQKGQLKSLGLKFGSGFYEYVWTYGGLGGTTGSASDSRSESRGFDSH